MLRLHQLGTQSNKSRDHCADRYEERNLLSCRSNFMAIMLYFPLMFFVAFVVSSGPANAGSMNFDVNILEQSDVRNALVEEYGRQAATHPEDATVRGNLGWLLLLNSLDRSDKLCRLYRFDTCTRFQEARQDLEVAVRLDPDNYQWQTRLGQAWPAIYGDNALAFYRRALELIPDEVTLRKGPIADFDLFIEKGWKPSKSKFLRKWFEWQWSRAQFESSSPE